MIWVAVVGSVGSGKTSSLSRLAAWLVQTGRPVKGFLALAHRRTVTGQGSQAYDLVNVATGERLRFAERVEGEKPAYRFDNESKAVAHGWLADPAEIAFLDELGPLEAEGHGGHAPLFKSLRAEVVLAAVRETVLEKLPITFDVVLRVDDPNLDEKLRAVVAEADDWQRVGLFGAGAGGVEMSLGSIVHATQLPLRGGVMSSVQAGFLTFAAAGLAVRRRVVWVAFIASGLKALSPAGNRVRPMIAIAVQGFLYGLGVGIGGWNAAGVSLGGLLVGAWAAGQGLLLQFVLAGSSVSKAYDALSLKLRDWLGLGLPALPVLAGAVMLLYGLSAAAVSLWAFRRRGALPAKLAQALESGTGPLSAGTRIVWKDAARDLTRPTFWIPALLIAAILFAANRNAWEAVSVILRSAAVGFALFALIRWFRPVSFVNWLRRKGHWGPAAAFSKALTSSAKSDPPETQDDGSLP